MPYKKPRLWHVYFVKNCSHVRPKPKDKFVVIVCIDKEARGFLINSRISSFVQKRPDLLACQAEINAIEDYVLKKDGFVDCSELYEFFEWELKKTRGRSVEMRNYAYLKQYETV